MSGDSQGKNSVHCPHCPFTAVIWVKGQNIGYRLMSEHVESEHLEEHRRVQKGLAELDEDIRRAEEQATGY